METLDFDWTAFQGFFELSKTKRDLSSPNVILTNGIRVIRQLKEALSFDSSKSQGFDQIGPYLGSYYLEVP